MTAYQLAAAIGSNTGQTTAAIFHLHKRHAIDCVESDVRLYWFATPGDDDRLKTIDERTPEEPGTRRRGAAWKKP